MARTGGDLRQYQSSVEALAFGKRVGPYLYIHKDGVQELSSSIRALVEYAAELASEQNVEFNIVKAGIRRVSLSLLNYPGFWRQAFPVLAQSAKLNLETHQLQIIDYSERKNRPVLHRKELLLPPGHGHYRKFSALTAQAEELGLLRETKSIGLEVGWRKTLKKANVKIVGHTLVRKGKSTPVEMPESSVEIARHKTAMRRQYLSQPMQSIQRYGYLNGDYSVFDYGCGRGDDVGLLRQIGIDAAGWDPHYCPKEKKKSADIVNLGFVVNVIEERRERDEVLKAAFRLAKKLTVVSALIGNPEYSGQSQEVGDGVVTSIGTFQKYFLPDELENYVRGVLKTQAISIAQGIIVAFSNNEEADRFRARRAGVRCIGQRGSAQLAADLFLLDQNARTVLSSFWNRCVELGRKPLPSDLSVSDSLEPLGLSSSAAYKFLIDKLGTEKIENTAAARSQEMLVQFALSQFDGRVYHKYLAEDVQEDVSVFFGGFSRLQERAKELLFSIADTELLKNASHEAASDGLGYLLADNTLQLHVSLVDHLPPILQVYVGCALRLVGGIGRANLVKIHFDTGKVSLMAYDDFDGLAIPHLIERIKINLWARKTEYFDYIAGYAPPPLLMKSLFLPEDYESYVEQSRFDSKLLREDLFDLSNPHPTRNEFEAILQRRGFQVKGFDLIQVSRGTK